MMMAPFLRPERAQKSSPGQLCIAPSGQLRIASAINIDVKLSSLCRNQWPEWHPMRETYFPSAAAGFGVAGVGDSPALGFSFAAGSFPSIGTSVAGFNTPGV